VAVVVQYLIPEAAQFLASAFPQITRNLGTNFPVSTLAFDGAGTAAERAYWKWSPIGYTSGPITCDLIWYPASGTSGGVVWEAAIAAITPDADTQDVETKAFAAAQTVTDTHLGSTARRLHRATITLSGSSLDSLADGDECWLRISRLPGNSSDTITADAHLTSVRLSYTV